MLRVPIVRIKDSLTGKEHIVGSNECDRLFIKDNSICYENTNTMSSSILGEEVFVGSNDTDYIDSMPNIEFVTIDEFIEMLLANNHFDGETVKRLNDAKVEYLMQEESMREERERSILLCNY